MVARFAVTDRGGSIAEAIAAQRSILAASANELNRTRAAKEDMEDDENDEGECDCPSGVDTCECSDDPDDDDPDDDRMDSMKKTQMTDLARATRVLRDRTASAFLNPPLPDVEHVDAEPSAPTTSAPRLRSSRHGLPRRGGSSDSPRRPEPRPDGR